MTSILFCFNIVQKVKFCDRDSIKLSKQSSQSTVVPTGINLCKNQDITDLVPQKR